MSKLTLSERGKVTSIPEQISSHARKLSSAGHDLKYMNVGQPACGASPEVMDFLQQQAKKDPLGYSDVSGIMPLREAIAQQYHDNYQIEIDPLQVMVTFGASGAFHLLYLGLFEPGQSVVLPLPYYPAYYNIAKIMGLNPILMPTSKENNFHPCVADLKKLDAKPDALLVTSPGNPSGSVIPLEQFKALIHYCEQNDIILISDEIYHGIVYDGAPKVDSALQFSDQVVVINSFSKYYSMAGWRVGWMVLPKEHVASLASMARSLYVSMTTASQYIALGTMADTATLNTHLQRYKQNRAIMMQEMPKAGYYDAMSPDGAFYYYAKAPSCTDSIAYCMKMMEQAGVVASPGVDFDPVDGDPYIRFSYAGSTEDIQEVVERLQNWYQSGL